MTRLKADDPMTYNNLKKKKSKKGGDDKPEGPKRPKSAFFCYQDVRRSQIKAENPDMNNTSIVKQMAVEYKKLSDAQKLPYVRLAEVEKQRYLTEKAQMGQQDSSKKAATPQKSPPKKTTPKHKNTLAGKKRAASPAKPQKSKKPASKKGKMEEKEVPVPGVEKIDLEEDLPPPPEAHEKESE